MGVLHIFGFHGKNLIVVNIIINITFVGAGSQQVYSNLALNQNAEQQDDYFDGNGPASKAVDGNRNGNWRCVVNYLIFEAN